MSRDLHYWQSAMPGSSLSVRATQQGNEEQEFLISANIRRDGQNFASWNHHQIINSSANLPMESGHYYSIHLVVILLGKDVREVRVEAFFSDRPDQSRYDHLFSGKNGKTLTAEIGVVEVTANEDNQG